MAILITTDRLGRQVQKVIPLNSQVQTTDAAGNIITEDTFVGSNVSQVPGKPGIYVKLQPVYANEQTRAAGIPAFYQAEYNGQLWVKTLSDQEILPASESSNRNVQEWYDTQREFEAGLLQRFQESNPEGPVAPELLPPAEVDVPAPAPLPPEAQLGQDLQPTQPLRPEGEPFTGPSGDRGFGTFDFSSLPSPTPAPSPTFEVSPSTPRVDVNKAVDFTNRLTSPEFKPSPLQASGFTVPALKPPPTDFLNVPDITTQLPPTTQPKAPGNIFTKAVESVKTGASKVKNWWEGLF